MSSSSRIEYSSEGGKTADTLSLEDTMRKMFAITNRHTGDIAKERNGDHAIFDTKTYAIFRAQVMTERSQEGGRSNEEFNVVPVKVPRISWGDNFFSRYAQGLASAWKNNVLGRNTAIVITIIAVLITVFMDDGTEPNTIAASTFMVFYFSVGVWGTALLDMPSQNESTLYQQAEILHHAKETVEV